MTQNELKVNRLHYEHPVCLFVVMDATEMICDSLAATQEDFDNLENFEW